MSRDSEDWEKTFGKMCLIKELYPKHIHTHNFLDPATKILNPILKRTKLLNRYLNKEHTQSVN